MPDSATIPTSFIAVLQRHVEMRGIHAPAYRVLASASPRDFGGARVFDVAGDHLIASSSLPAGSGWTGDGNRRVTFFRVQ